MLIIFHVSGMTAVFSDDLNLNGIAGDIKKYMDTRVTLAMRLKYYDSLFNKIVFYDTSNIDIEFTITPEDVKGKFKNQILNLHRGMDYFVTFRVLGVGGLGFVRGHLIECGPVVLEKLGDKTKKAE